MNPNINGGFAYDTRDAKRQKLDAFAGVGQAADNVSGLNGNNVNLVTTHQFQVLSNEVNKLHSKLDDMSNKFDAITQCLDYILNETLLGATQGGNKRAPNRLQDAQRQQN